MRSHHSKSKHTIQKGHNIIIVPLPLQFDQQTTTIMSHITTNQLKMESEWRAKEIPLDQIASKIANGSKLYIGSCAATPDAILQALVDDYRLADIQIIQMIPGGNLPHLNENMDRFRTSSFYSFDKKAGFFDAEEGVASCEEGLKDYTPVGVNQVPRLLDEQKLKVDVALSKYY